MRPVPSFLCLCFVLFAAVACRVERAPNPEAASPMVGPCERALAPLPPGEPLGVEIAQWQQRARRGHLRDVALERLAQAFVARARLVAGSESYSAAEDAIRCFEQARPDEPEVLLLRGHVLHQQHRFRDAEVLARRLVDVRGSALDYGLLGDTLMERGRLDEAIAAYQRMMNQRPFYQSYVRAAHARWLKGDLRGAIEMTELAIDAASPRDPEAKAWAHTRLALYELQAGRLTRADRASDAALSWRRDYPAALVTEGRLALARREPAEAARLLRRAVDQAPEPDYLWALADALRAAGRTDEASRVDAELMRTGAARDPRTFALYLATRGEQPSTALALAERELDERADVFTLDAHAWALASAGRVSEARARMAEALTAGTDEARLLFHAGAIAARAGARAEARRLLADAWQQRHLLWPSEQAALAEARSRVP